MRGAVACAVQFLHVDGRVASQTQGQTQDTDSLPTASVTMDITLFNLCFLLGV